MSDLTFPHAGFNQAAEHSIARVIRPRELLLVPLQTEREGMRWNLYRLNDPIIRVCAGDDRVRKLFDCLAMKSIDEQASLLEQGSQPGVRCDRDIAHMVALVVLEDGR